MKRIFTFLITIALLGAAGLKAQVKTVSLADETLTYDVMYKWGFISKVAGYATMSLRSDGNYYQASVTARNAPWANSIYTLRDTLCSTMTKAGLYPVKYTFIAHENGKYKKDVLTFRHTGDEFDVRARRYKQAKAGAPVKQTEIELSGKGVAVDMLSSFYYLRSLDFDNMKVGQSVTVNIFSGSKKELLKITYLGHSTVEWNGEKLDSYYINFTFTRKGVKSSAPIKGWISADSRRIPLKVEGRLPVGKVRAIYTGLNP